MAHRDQRQVQRLAEAFHRLDALLVARLEVARNGEVEALAAELAGGGIGVRGREEREEALCAAVEGGEGEARFALGPGGAAVAPTGAWCFPCAGHSMTAPPRWPSRKRKCEAAISADDEGWLAKWAEKGPGKPPRVWAMTWADETRRAGDTESNA